MTTFLCLAAVSAEILWTKPICVETNRYIGWPTVCRRANGELLAVFSGDREEHVCPYGRVQLVRSADGGEMWSEIHETGIPGFPPHLIKLADGRILSSYGRRDEGHYGEYAAVSSDGGKSWEVDAFALDVNPPCFPWDLGYPSTVQFPDGTFLTTYYQSPDRETKPRLMATRWRILTDVRR